MHFDHDHDQKKHTLFLTLVSVVGVTLFIALPIVFSFINSTDRLNQQEVVIARLENDIQIEEEEILEIQTEMKSVIQEYTDYEQSSNELVVTNLNPQVVLNMYPDLKSNNLYNKLNRQYLTSMRNIKDSKEEYNNAVEEYNRTIVTIHNRILHNDRKPKEFYK